MSICEIKAVDLGHTNAEMERTNEAFQGAIAAAPAFQGQAYRGIAVANERLESFLGSFRPGRIMVNNAHTSFTKNASLVDGIAGRAGPGKTPVIFRAKAKNGADISGVGTRQIEGEIVVSKGARFKVVGVKRENGRVVIDIEETGAARGARSQGPASLSGEGAAKPKDFVPEASIKSDAAFQKAENGWLDSLTDQEREAFRAWSGSTGYTRIREFQMTGVERGNVPEVTAILDKALARAPRFKGAMYRGVSGMPREIVAQHKVGRTIKLEAHSSFSANFDKARDFSGVSLEDRVAVIYRVNSRSGVNMQRLSKITNEEEVLGLAGTRYRIINVTEQAGKGGLFRKADPELTKIIIDLEEIP